MKRKSIHCSASMNFVNDDKIVATLYSLANSVFILENKIKSKQKFPKVLTVDIYYDIDNNTRHIISRLLNILIADVLCEDIIFNLKYKDTITPKKQIKKFNYCKTICLYSGGVDSSIGILKSLEKYKEVLGLYVAHRYTGRMDHKVNELYKSVLKPQGINLEKFIAPEWRKGEYSQTRGFLYLLYAGMLARYTNAERIIVSECGQTMYQPKFAPLDTITYTTNPYVLQIAKTIIELVMRRKIDIIIPFEDFTKSELISVLPQDELLSRTQSCILSMFARNCGLCYACITRMIGSINNNLSVSYFKDNAFIIPNSEALNSLINFCLDYTFNKKYLDFWSFRSIENFKKVDLFNRMADEVFLALYKLYKKGMLHPQYKSILDQYTLDGYDKILNREKQLKRKREPNFNKKVQLYII